ncbi:hypothetical protein [Arthrobacter sp. UYCo732]|uniref:hypothetical protein n=1 Tax=Arthrobacter sp. UYCo732 TaxID=3156336 RepID=UPI0033969B6D
MPRQSKWTRIEIQTADQTAEMMGLTRATVLKRYTTESRRRQAAEHGMPVEDWVEANLAADRFLITIESMYQRGESAAAIALETGKPEADIRKIIHGIFGDQVGQDLPDIFDGQKYKRDDLEAAASAASREGRTFTEQVELWVAQKEIAPDPDGISFHEWEDRQRARKAVADSFEKIMDSGLSGEDPFALPVPKFIIRRPDELRHPPRKERDQAAQDRALGLSMQLGVSMRTAWKYYDEANAARIEQEDDLAWTVLQLHRQGKAPAEIADMTGVSKQEIESFLNELPSGE